MRRVSQFLAPELARTSLSAVVSDIRDSMMEETDLRKEAANIDAFTAFLEQSGLTAYAKAPFVFRDAARRLDQAAENAERRELFPVRKQGFDPGFEGSGRWRP